jgi:hypothetical protein
MRCMKKSKRTVNGFCDNFRPCCYSNHFSRTALTPTDWRQCLESGESTVLEEIRNTIAMLFLITLAKSNVWVVRGLAGAMVV